MPPGLFNKYARKPKPRGVKTAMSYYCGSYYFEVDITDANVLT